MTLTLTTEIRRDARRYFRWARINMRDALKARKAGDYDTYHRLRATAGWFLEYRHKLLSAA